jgi:hypothetical protein
VPLTSSLYVPGRLLDVENVLIDIGTGYYIQKVRLHFLLRWGLFMHNAMCAIDTGAGGKAL